MNSTKMNSESDIHELMQDIGRAAKAASTTLALASTDQKNAALSGAADAIRANSETILTANKKDMDIATARNLNKALLDRLFLDEDRVAAMADGMEAIIKLADPVGDVMDNWQRPNGLDISRVRVPLGVIGIIYESRPNVTVDAGVLCLKAGNAAILRGGERKRPFQPRHPCLPCRRPESRQTA